MAEKLRIAAEHAPKLWEWIQKRGGVKNWQNVNLSGGNDFQTPALTEDFKPFPKPHWTVAEDRVITDANEIELITGKLWKKFHGAVRMGGQGMSLKLTDGASRKLRSYVAKANESVPGRGAWYQFNYGEHANIEIYVPDKIITLQEWANQQPKAS